VGGWKEGSADAKRMDDPHQIRSETHIHSDTTAAHYAYLNDGHGQGVGGVEGHCKGWMKGGGAGAKPHMHKDVTVRARPGLNNCYLWMHTRCVYVCVTDPIHQPASSHPPTHHCLQLKDLHVPCTTLHHAALRGGLHTIVDVGIVVGAVGGDGIPSTPCVRVTRPVPVKNDRKRSVPRESKKENKTVPHRRIQTKGARTSSLCSCASKR
jgi:hypothetical protein